MTDRFFLEQAGWSAMQRATEMLCEAEYLRSVSTQPGQQCRAERAADMDERGMNWLRGALGEKRLALALASLKPRGSFPWFLDADLVEPDGSQRNIDALLIGECGIVAFDAKAWREPISVIDDSLYWGDRRVTTICELERQRQTVRDVIDRLGHPGIRVHLSIVQLDETPTSRGLLGPDLSIIGLNDLDGLLDFLFHDLSTISERLEWEDARELAWRLPHYLLNARVRASGLSTGDGHCPVCGSLGGLCMGPN